MNLPGKPWSLKWEKIVKGLEVSPEKGLNVTEARRRHKQFGPNLLVRLRRLGGRIRHRCSYLHQCGDRIADNLPAQVG